MSYRISLWAREIAAHGEGRATIRGEVWLGPIAVGDRFTSATIGIDSRDVRLRLEEIATPNEEQEVGRVARVVAILGGEQLELLQPGAVLLGQAERAWVLR